MEDYLFMFELIYCPECNEVVNFCPYYIKYDRPGINQVWIRCPNCLHCRYIKIPNHFGEQLKFKASGW